MLRPPPTPRDADDEKVLRDVAQFGCHIVGVLEDEQGPAFSYSIGFWHHFGHPEVLMVGLAHELMQAVINDLGREMRQGVRYAPRTRYPGLLADFDCEFRPVDPSHHRELFGYARWFYHGEEFPALQCVWPDMRGRFPGEAGFPTSLLERQPTFEKPANPS